METIKILVVDDTITYRKILSDAVKALPDAELIGAMPTGQLALRKLEQDQADLVLLDVSMPDMDGVETLQHIRERFPDTEVLMISGVTDRQAATTIKALELGALDFIQKPEGHDYESSMRLLTDNIKPVLRLVATRRLTRKIRGGSPVAPPSLSPAAPTVLAVPARSYPAPKSLDMVVIGVSTGGPNALAVVIPALPADLSVPVLLVQHMPPMFTASLAEHLDKRSPLNIQEARDGQPILPGMVLIAPGGRHLVARRNANGLFAGVNDGPPVNSCRPSVDVLFRSAADAVAGGILAVILTGMGDDGVGGVAALKRHGCYCLAQDENSCVVYGMPRAVAERGLADEILPLDAVAGRIAALIRRGRP